MHAVNAVGAPLAATGWEKKPCQVFFGGSYREVWSANYTLAVKYDGQRAVQAAWVDGRWQAVDGDRELVRLLESPWCREIVQQYFQASAEVCAGLQSCRDRGLPLTRLWEFLHFDDDPLAAAELMRRLMDEHGFSMDAAFLTAGNCCGDLHAASVDVEQIYPLQPRTAHVITILRSFSHITPIAVHNSASPAYRTPVGALEEGSPLRLRVNLLSGKAQRASLILYGDALRQEYPMERDDYGFSVSLRVPDKAAALWYCFRIETDKSSHWLCPDESGYMGRLYGKEVPGFRLTLYRRGFETPAWVRGSVMYQIFPDRFAFSDDGTAEAGIAYHQALGQTPELHGSITEPVRWQPRPFERDYTPNDFYGGTLRGIQNKLPYLQELGVNCLYLNPIVEAGSNHRYDASDYSRVDPILGSNSDFEALCRAAAERGIRVVLDGVYSHTGADSVYFDRFGHYGGHGACQGKDSPYYGWYDFKHFPDKYRCWWGFKDLPEVEETNESWQQFVVTGPDSIVKTWLRRGASGWRLDVADELPDEVLSLIRTAAREEKPDALILGEVWEDAVLKVSYGERRNYALGCSLDSVMNYPLRTAVLDFIHKRRDACALRDFLLSQRLHYPQPLYYSLMNLLGSHDVERLRTALARDVAIRDLSREEQMHLYYSPEELNKALRLEKLCAVIQFALPGMPSIYYGDEQGMCGVRDPFNRLPFREGNRDLHDYYAALANMRLSAPALKTGQVQFGVAGADVLLILRYIHGGRDAFGESAEDGAYLAVINRGETPADYELDASAAGLGWVRGRIDACSAELRAL